MMHRNTFFPSLSLFSPSLPCPFLLSPFLPSSSQFLPFARKSFETFLSKQKNENEKKKKKTLGNVLTHSCDYLLFLPFIVLDYFKTAEVGEK